MAEVNAPVDVIYKLILPILLEALTQAKNADELVEELDVHKTQLNLWLKKALDQNLIVKKSKPVRYQKA